MTPARRASPLTARPALTHTPKPFQTLTFDTDDVLTDLLGHHGVREELNEVINGVDAGVYGLKALYLLPYGQGAAEVGLVVPATHGGGT